jgi:hypothetical protein
LATGAELTVLMVTVSATLATWPSLTTRRST